MLSETEVVNMVKREERAPEEKAEKSKQKKRLNLELNPDAYELLQKLADESGKNMTDVLRTGLALYGIAHEEAEKGRELAIVDKDNEKVVKSILMT